MKTSQRIVGTCVFPLGWNWHDMDPLLFPNEIRHYLGQTFNARSSGIVELRNHSIGGRSPKSIFTLWQLWINICIFFQKFFWLFEQCPVQPLWVLGMRCLHLPVRALSKVLLLPVWVWLVLPSTAYSKGMLPLQRCQPLLILLNHYSFWCRKSPYLLIISKGNQEN